MSSPAPPPPLPYRPPRPVGVHFLVDSAVAFLAVVVVALILGIPFWLIVVLAVAIGAACAPLTRRAEERALAARRAAPGADGN
jgi:hypothetical protein